MRSTFLYFSFFLLFFNNIKTKKKRKQKRQREKGEKKKNNVRRHKEVKIRKRMCSSASYRRTYKTYMENTNGSPNTFSFKQKE